MKELIFATAMMITGDAGNPDKALEYTRYNNAVRCMMAFNFARHVSIEDNKPENASRYVYGMTKYMEYTSFYKAKLGVGQLSLDKSMAFHHGKLIASPKYFSNTLSLCIKWMKKK